MSPWELPGVPWKTESAFWGWVRGVLRKGWSRHPVKTSYVMNNRKRITKAGTDREIWGCNCELCHKDFPQGSCEVDHITASGSLRSKEDIQGFVERLFYVTYEDIRILCKPCHSLVTLAQQAGITFDEAIIEQKVIAVNKKPVSEIKAWLISKGCTPASNAAARRKQIKEVLENEQGS